MQCKREICRCMKRILIKYSVNNECNRGFKIINQVSIREINFRCSVFLYCEGRKKYFAPFVAFSLLTKVHKNHFFFPFLLYSRHQTANWNYTILTPVKQSQCCMFKEHNNTWKALILRRSALVCL